MSRGVTEASATESLIERLKKWSNPAEIERIMCHWDTWRKYIKEGGGGSWPRDAFESLLDAFGQESTEAATELEALRSRCERMEKERGEDMVLVPREPTDAMYAAARAETWVGSGYCQRIWHAMIAAIGEGT